jgi:hypothetical protein
MRSPSTILLALVITLGAVPLVDAQGHDEDRGRGHEKTRGPVVASVRAPFFADTVNGGRIDRLFAATVLTALARVPAAWPLVLDASIVVDGDPVKGPLGDLRCAPAIDGVLAVPIPVPQPDSSVPGDVAPRTPVFPDLHWQGTFTAGPIPPGRHAFTLECEGTSAFQIRGSASLRVIGNPSGRSDR